MAREEWFPECGEYRGSMCEGEQVGGGTATVVGYLFAGLALGKRSGQTRACE